jgi:hypothetical protein
MRGGHLAILRSGFGATKESEMAAGDIVPVPGAQFEETLACKYAGSCIDMRVDEMLISAHM